MSFTGSDRWLCSQLFPLSVPATSIHGSLCEKSETERPPVFQDEGLSWRLKTKVVNHHSHTVERECLYLYIVKTVSVSLHCRESVCMYLYIVETVSVSLHCLESVCMYLYIVQSVCMYLYIVETLLRQCLSLHKDAVDSQHSARSPANLSCLPPICSTR